MDNNGCTPLDIACYKGDLECTKILVLSGANLKNKDNNGATCLHKASISGHLDCMEMIIKVDKSLVNEKDNFGRSPLFYASHFSKFDAIKLLIQNGSSILEKDKFGASFIHVIAFHNRVKILSKIMQMLDENTKQQLLSDKDKKGNTILHLACKKNNLQFVQFLLENSKNVIEINSITFHKQISPLHLACFYTNEELVTLLIENGGFFYLFPSPHL